MIYLEPEIITQLSQDAFRTYPDECCGFLLGVETTKNRFIKEIIVIQNAKEGDKKRRFEITPFDYLKAENDAEEKGLSLLGIYHSHPNHPSIPSEHDRIVAQPYFSYVIISTFQNQIKSIQSWILNENFQFEEEKIFQNQKLTPFNIKDLWLQ